MDLIIYFWFLTLFLFIYNVGRSYFTVVPVLINWISTDNWNYYQGLNKQKFLVFIFLTILSITFAFVFLPKVFKSESWFEVIYLLGVSIILQMSMTTILEMKAPSSPSSMIINYVKHNFEFDLDNSKEIVNSKSINISQSVKSPIFQIKRQFFSYKKIFGKIEEVLDNTNQIREGIATTKFLLTKSELNFDIKKKLNINISNIIAEYYISTESKNNLEDFLNGNKVYGKIIFTKSAGSGPSLKEIFLFFSEYTNIFELYDNNKLTQEKVKNILNEIVVGTYKNKQKDNPISNYNITKFHPKINLGNKKR